jgi:hypothetical protein
MTKEERRRCEWEKRFPSLDNEWTHWWLEGDDTLLAVVAAADLTVALQVVERHHDQCRHVIAYSAKLDSFGEIVKAEHPGCEIYNREVESPPGADLATQGQCCLCGRILAETDTGVASIRRSGEPTENLRCHDECLRVRLVG